MNIRILCAPIPLLVSTVVFGFAQEPREKGKPAGRPPMPIFIAPFYDSDGIKVSVGELSKKLARADAKTILQISNALKKKGTNSVPRSCM